MADSSGNRMVAMKEVAKETKDDWSAGMKASKMAVGMVALRAGYLNS